MNFFSQKFQKILPILILIFVSLAFSWKYLIGGLIPIPSDIIVGIYYPWRDYIWNGFVAGVPYKNWLLSDVVSIIYPWRIFGIDLIKQGVSPLWIPFTLGGSPLLANFQSGLLYPLNLLFWLLPNIHAWSVYIILQPVFFSIFLYLFLRSINISKPASIFGSLIFAFCGFNMVWFEYGILGHAGLWLPLFLLTVEKMKTNKKIFWLIGCSFFIAFSFLAGYPQITIYSLIFFVLYILFRFFSTKDFVYLLPFLSIIGGLLVSAVQLIPGAELLIQSIRQTDPTTASFSYGIIPIKQFILFIFPDFFGNPSTGNSWGWAGYNESAVYIGIVGLVFALSTFFTKRKDTSFFFKVFFLILILFTFKNPVADLIQKINLPGLATASRGRLLFLIDFCLAVLASIGMENFLRKGLKKSVILADITVGALIIFTWIYVFFAIKFLKLPSDLIKNLSVSERNLIFPSIVFLFFQPFVFLQSKLKKILFVGLILVSTVDLFRFGLKYNPFSSKEYLFPKTELTDFLISDAGINRISGLIPQSMWISYGLYSLEGYDSLMVNRYAELMSGASSQNNQIGLSSRWVKIDNVNSRTLDLLGVKYLLAYRENPETGWDPEYYKLSEKEFKLIFQKGKSQIYERINAFPRTYLVHNYIVETNKENILKFLKNKNLDFKDMVILEEEPQLMMEPKNGQEQASIKKGGYPRNDFFIRTNSNSNGLLFLSDVYYSGWKAYVDGSPQKILRANYAFKAVEIPKGVHEVHFVYDPFSFKIGFYISIFSMIILTGGLICFKLIKTASLKNKNNDL